MNRFNGNEVSGFLKAKGQKLINGEGQEVLLRGVGFGSWLLPEGYMWRFPKQGDRPRRIERMIYELIGKEKSEQFWKIYYERYVSEADIRQIAAEGFNSVRVPISARFLLEEGQLDRYRESHLQLIDQVIAWCKTYRLYVILDLHGAPGGQTGTNIDDSEFDRPDLFTDERNKRSTVDMWRMLARRYKDEWIVAGYDLLNEPLPDWFSAYNDKVMPLYRDIVEAIREVDDRHLIILEGVHWSTDWSIFTEKIDDNLMLQFHKYWNNPDTESIQGYLDKKEEWNVPIFMGEGGENNKDWYAGAFRLFEDHDISWNFWTWKKMDTDNSPCSIIKPTKWMQLIDYLEGGNKPDKETAESILWEYLDNLTFDKCVYHPEVVHSLLRKPSVRIPAIFYGFKGEGVSYGVTNRSDQSIGFRINDGTDLQFIEGSRMSPNFQHGGGESWSADERLCIQLAAEDWLAYEITNDTNSESPFFTIDIRLSAPIERGYLTVSVDGTTVGQASAKGKPWEIVRVNGNFSLEPGLHRIVLKAMENPVRIEWLEVKDTL
ncbi:Cellulase (glycosyl hydrolase family 5) [Paenibacillus sp. yr247]|uniref:cellulase family glycosylhydrolase n=1 Tax=Paenibacillus sp. yr247 TaxID=1761880 RepID=UPI000889E49E|nr:cellulase family glycosylhydrolase [Paenibacillus sp. yr247]SDO78076.1 Cellulase (glycosyl hydrolase family 5) [Paenibacillus sp. yr247]